jgi:N-(2-amino-2-carboxyethyl)-L-glutamate synthase
VQSTGVERFSLEIGHTPICAVEFLIHGRWRAINLKLEGANPMGSSKDRTAAALIADLARRGLLDGSRVILESTSGNLGVSLSFFCQQLGYRFVAVVDPKITAEIRQRMVQLGTELELVDEPDVTGGYLLSRLERIRRLCASSEQYVWTDQYNNLANPEAHYRSTGPEIYEQMQGNVDAIFVAVSTGGTLAGIGRYFREVSCATQVIGVDAVGSVVFGTVSGARKLTGIGSSQPSSFLRQELYDFHLLVEDRDAFAMCRQMDEEAGLRLGGSSGAVLSACVRYLAERPNVKRVVCVCPDWGHNYCSTIFSDNWLFANGFDPECRPLLSKKIRVETLPASVAVAIGATR